VTIIIMRDDDDSDGDDNSGLIGVTRDKSSTKCSRETVTKLFMKWSYEVTMV